MHPMTALVMIGLPAVIVLIILIATLRTVFQSPLAKGETLWCQAAKTYPRWKLEKNKLTIVYKNQERIYTVDRVARLDWNEAVIKSRSKMGVAIVHFKDGLHFMLTYHFDHKERGYAALEALKAQIAETSAQPADAE